MIYTPKIKQAIKLMCKAHEGQVGRDGLPYMLHPYHIAEQMPDDDDMIITALLHDVVEDTACTLKDIRECGFGSAVTRALELLTRDADKEYMDYIQELAPNRIARTVKIADLEHNMDLDRLKNVGDEDLERIAKYREAWLYLKNCASRESDSETKDEMRRECPMRNANNGNCGPVSGFCTAVNDEICEAIHNAYECGIAHNNHDVKKASQKNIGLSEKLG